MITTLSYLAIAAGAFALGRLSERKRHRLRSLGADQPPVRLSPQDSGIETRRPMTGERLFVLVFLTGWLIAWSAGCAVVIKLVLSGSGNLFVYGWLIAALAGWVYAANTIYRLICGKPVTGRGGREF